MAKITPPGGWNCILDLLPEDMKWVWVCLDGQCCGACCKAHKAQFMLSGNQCGTPATGTETNPDCATSEAVFMVPIPSCGDTGETCNLMYIPWYKVSKWGGITAGTACGDNSPGTLPCTMA